MAKYPKLKNFWFPERTEKALSAIRKHHGLPSEAEAVRYLIREEFRRMGGIGDATQ